MSAPIFRIQNVSKSYGNHIVIDNISLDIYSGEIMGIIGASGAGKTTFLNTIIGFIRPDKGDVQFRLDHLLSYRDAFIYRSVFKKRRDVKKVYGFASQVPSFYEELTTKENLEYFGSLHGLSKDAINSNVETLLSLMNLHDSANVLAKNLSGGMERRLDIACALIHDPDVLILDEPTADLDPLLRTHILDLTRKINKKGTTIILSSHHLSELETICDRVAIIKDGKLLAVGKPEELKKRFIAQQEIVLQIASENYNPIIARLSKKGIKNTAVEKGILHIYIKNPESIIIDVMSAIKEKKEKLKYIKVAGASLDDVFVSIWKKK